MTNDELIQKALESQKNSYSPYSKYKVGCALLCTDDTVYTGTNIENASYPCGICAERVAMSKAVSDGKKSFKAIAICGSSQALCTPCGICRQFLYEFAPDLTVLCGNSDKNYKQTTLKELLPEGFVSQSM